MEEHSFKRRFRSIFLSTHHATKLVGSIINILTNTIVVDIGNNDDLSHIEPRQVVRINHCKK